MSAKSAPLLVELFTEELPPKALKRLGDAFAESLGKGLSDRHLLESNWTTTVFATPRRLAALFSAVLEQAKDQPVETKLMPLAVARGPDGKASPALRKKLANEGRASLADLFPDGSDGPDSFTVVTEGKSDFVWLKTLARGQSLQIGLLSALEDAIENLPIPKVMSYQLSNSTETVKFVRPAHGLVALHGSEIVNVHALGLTAGRATHGHRFLGERDIELKHADEYEVRLKDVGKVIARFDTRRDQIEAQLKAKAAELNASLGDYAALLDEVTALVEWPVVYVASFEKEFLSVPQECLILTMRTNQKYFPLFDKTGNLTERFLVVSNMEVADPINIIEGNQRVVRPRLADARFFYEQDRKKKLADRVDDLEAVVFHNKLGTQLDRVKRIQSLAGVIACLIGADSDLAKRAAWLSKADLVTGMVGEFPELQGTMGRYYALHDGERVEVANAIEQHYRPRFAGDNLPEGLIACSVALADKLYILVGMFAVGAAPTGEKDPFSLRRQALGVLRIMMEIPGSLDLFQLLRSAEEAFPPDFIKSNPNDLRDFLRDRLRNFLREQGEDSLQIEAVVSQVDGLIYQTKARLNAVKEFVKLPEAKELASTNKRVLNIIHKNDEIRHRFVTPKRELMTEPAEIALMEAVERLAPVAKKHFESGEYEESLCLLSKIKPDVDLFFDKVMVMVEDVKIRNNRAALLQQLGLLMNQVADISKLAA